MTEASTRRHVNSRIFALRIGKWPRMALTAIDYKLLRKLILAALTQVPEQSVELVGVPMHVTGDVVVHELFLTPLWGDRNCLFLPVTLNYQWNATIDHVTAHNAH